jgi:hypothetical protein
MMITAEELRKLLAYDADTGVFVWKVSRGNDIGVGSAAGSANGRNRKYIRVNGKKYQAHRLAWLYVYGTWPADQLDHVDGNTLNNCIENLREATNAENCQNRGIRSDNKSGYMGVSWRKDMHKWEAQIQRQGRKYQLGFFETPEAAHAAYLNAKAELHLFQPTPRNTGAI